MNERQGKSMRPNERPNNQIRDVKITRNFTKYAEGSVLIECGNTKVLCNASIEESVPRFLRGQNQGWITAEYQMLPRATHSRTPREAARGKQGGRTLEIQRLIGRSLRSVVDLKKLGERTITLDCDVIQADGGTRCASITGAFIALYDAISSLLEQKKIKENPINNFIAAVSVGIVNGKIVCDLEYSEDSNADTDMNVVMTDAGKFVEIQGTAEEHPFSVDELHQLLALAQNGVNQLIQKQKEVLLQK